MRPHFQYRRSQADLEGTVLNRLITHTLYVKSLITLLPKTFSPPLEFLSSLSLFALHHLSH